MFGSEQLVAKIIGKWQKQTTIKMVQPKFSPGLGEIDGKMISTWNLGESAGPDSDEYSSTAWRSTLIGIAIGIIALLIVLLMAFQPSLWS